MNQSKYIYTVLFLFSIILYGNTLTHGYVLDDFSVIKENTVVKQGLEGIPTIWKTHYRYGYGYLQANLYRPLTLSLFAIQWQIAPDTPSIAHFFNILLYTLLGLLIFHLLELILKKENRLISFLTSLFFIAHPIHTEVVANIKSVDDILVMLFSLSGIVFLLKYLESKRRLQLIGSLLLFTLSFLSKESTVVFIPIILLILIHFRSYQFFPALKLTGLYLIPFVFYSILRIQVLGSFKGDKTMAVLDNFLVSAPNELVRVATAIKILGLYLWKLILPHPLMNDYSLNQIELTAFNSYYPLISLVIYTTLIYLIFKFWKSRPILSFSIAFYLLGISLYSNLFFTIGTSFGERLLFIPSLGFCLAVAYLIQLPFRNKINSLKLFKTAKTPLLIAGILIMAYSFKSIDRNKAWKDNFTLYSTDIKNCDKSARCHYYYGLGLMKEKGVGEKDLKLKQNYIFQAIQSFKKAIEIYPGYADAWGQKGLGFYRLKNYPEAEKAYLKALQFNTSDATTSSNLGSLYFKMKNYQAAKSAFERAIQINPRHIDALANYASTLGTLGEYNKAIVYFKKAIELKPNDPNYYQMVGITYQNLNNPEEADYFLQKAQQLRRAP